MNMTRRNFIGNSAMAAGAVLMPAGEMLANGAELQPYLLCNAKDCRQCESLNPHFKKAFDFLSRPDLSTLPNGVYPLAGEDCRAIIQETELVPLEERPFEYHRRFIDIQTPITGPEMMGIFRMDEAHLALPFDEADDCAVFKAKAELVTVVRPGTYAVFFPSRGAHAPGCLVPDGPRRIRKVVVKVRV